MQNKLLYIAAAIVLALLPVLTSCGYRFTPVGGVVPESAKTIAVPVFINGTNEPYVDVEVTKAVVDEFLSDGRLKVVNLEGADLILRGKITKFDLTPTSYTTTTNSYVQNYNISIGVSLSLEDAKTQKALLQGVQLGTVFNAQYPVTIGDITATKIAKETAIKSASTTLASSIRSAVLEGF